MNPAARKKPRSRAKIVLLSLGALCALAVILVITGGYFESWRAARDWHQCKAGLEAKGEHLYIDDFIPPPVPDDKNFALGALMKPLFDPFTDPQTGETVTGDPNAPVHQITLKIPGSGNSYPPSAGWQTGHFRSLEAWQGYFRQSSAPAAPAGSAPGDVLAALQKFDPAFAELRAELQARPLCRYPLRYEAGMAMMLPHLSALTDIARVLGMRASAELALNRPDLAFDDVILAYRVGDTIRSEPTLIDGLVRITIAAILQQPVWEGIASHKWTADQLAALETELRNWDCLADFNHCMRVERCAENWACGKIRSDPNTIFGITGGKQDYGTLFRIGFIRAWLVAATYRNQIWINNFFQDKFLTIVDENARTVSVPRAREEKAAIDTMSVNPYTFLARLTMPIFAPIPIKFAQEQTYIDEAAIACEIERYRIAHGRLPPALDDLHMPAMPHDIINGQPLRYRIKAPDNYLLYSVGWNETDDGGKVELNEKGFPDGKSAEQGDWVWTLKPLQ